MGWNEAIKLRSASLPALCLLYVTCALDASGAASYAKEAVITETAGTVRIAADSPRPLEQVLNALQSKYGWIVNYEDPQYVSAVDVIKASSDSQVPSGGSFTFEFSSAAPDEGKTLRQLVDTYNKSKNPGHFELRHTADGGFNVVGTAGHSDKGEIVEQQAPFDLALTLSNKEQTIDETVTRICAEVSRQSRSNVVLAISPRKILFQNRVALGGNKVAARELLSKSLGATHGKIYWRLLFDPESKNYYLNLHLVHGV
ncbi:MAG TPA: hypothetical protein VMP68_20385 [Candidatus Eisenbacteria bacterium]|nr:hypothetical protein [Candidatus Eisenbacteria bacterium]